MTPPNVHQLLCTYFVQNKTLCETRITPAATKPGYFWYKGHGQDHKVIALTITGNHLYKECTGEILMPYL